MGHYIGIPTTCVHPSSNWGAGIHACRSVPTADAVATGGVNRYNLYSSTSLNPQLDDRPGVVT